MADKFNVNARAGFMPFDITELQDLWTNLMDGNYWTAFRRAISLLDSLINPTVGRTRAYTHTVEIAEQVDDCCDKLEAWIEEHKDDPEKLLQSKNKKTMEPNADAVPIGEIIVLITMILQFISDWRKRRNQPPTPPATRKFTVRPNPLAKGKLMGDEKKETPPEVNRPAGVTNDQPAPMASNPKETTDIPVTEETNTKADTLAGEQSYAPGEAKHTKDGSDVAEQRPLEGANPTPAVTPPATTPPPKSPATTPPPKSPPPTPPKSPPKK